MIFWRGSSAVCSSQGGPLSFLTNSLSIYQSWMVVFAIGKLKCCIRLSSVGARATADRGAESGTFGKVGKPTFAKPLLIV